jgi:predicted  nucleic acid-binding Zn-ribbon protein
MNQAEALFHLQEIELGILRRQRRLNEIATALENSEIVQTAQKRVDNAENALRPLRAKMKDLELEIQSNVQKTKATEQRLYGGTVKNPKELQDMQQEIASLQNWHGELENRLLEAMVAVEDAESEEADSQANLESVTATWERDHQDLLDEKTQLEQQVADLKQQHKNALTHVTPDSLKTYTSLKTRKNNQPVAAMNGRTCAVCGIEQTSALAQEVRRGAVLVYCEGCERILVNLT